VIVPTTRGEMDVRDLEPRVGEIDDDEKTVTWVEYRYQGELVHRSVEINKKEPFNLSGATSEMR
jgi:hypothetical protein